MHGNMQGNMHRAVKLTEELCNIMSVSGSEADIALYTQNLLSRLDYLEITRVGNCVVAKTNFGLKSRIILAGHLDTVPISEKTQNFPAEFRGADKFIWGRGTVDMKAGNALFLAIAEHFSKNPDALKYDLTFIFYDFEEVAADKNGLGVLAREHKSLLQGDFAILGEPTGGAVEAGCNGTLRFDVSVDGKAAHSARAWVGENAIHKVTPVLEILRAWNETEHAQEVDGLVYREGLNATCINGGIAPNVIPDKCTVHINYRFAPNKTLDNAKDYVVQLFHDYTVEFKDLSPGARPGADRAVVREFASVVREKTGQEIAPKYGWTDVARFTELGIPALNFGPGDALLAHHDDEQVSVAQIEEMYGILEEYLSK